MGFGFGFGFGFGLGLGSELGSGLGSGLGCAQLAWPPRRRLSSSRQQASRPLSTSSACPPCRRAMRSCSACAPADEAAARCIRWIESTASASRGHSGASTAHQLSAITRSSCNAPSTSVSSGSVAPSSARSGGASSAHQRGGGGEGGLRWRILRSVLPRSSAVVARAPSSDGSSSRASGARATAYLRVGGWGRAGCVRLRGLSCT